MSIMKNFRVVAKRYRYADYYVDAESKADVLKIPSSKWRKGGEWVQNDENNNGYRHLEIISIEENE